MKHFRKKYIMKRLIITAAMVALFATGSNAEEYYTKHNYKFTMSLAIPRVYDNMQSEGYRKVQQQRITGVLSILYPVNAKTLPEIEVTGLVNKTHKDSSKKNITYETTCDEALVVLLGSNKKDTFTTPSITCSLVCEPSYSIGEKVTTDNSLFIQLSGRGSTKKVKYGRIIKSVSGKVTGTLGCGCTDYGHTSPTRVADAYGPRECDVIDRASVDGTWKISYLSTECVTR